MNRKHTIEIKRNWINYKKSYSLLPETLEDYFFKKEIQIINLDEHEKIIFDYADYFTAWNRKYKFQSLSLKNLFFQIFDNEDTKNEDKFIVYAVSENKDTPLCTFKFLDTDSYFVYREIEKQIGVQNAR
tara:strand:+ start:318 stop:704 length:387 start_codon:yes stop_codon:yes gene_type:complete